MRFSIDIRYIIVTLLKSILGYALGLTLAFTLLRVSDPYMLIFSSFAAAIFIFFTYFYPKAIVVSGSEISFSTGNSYKRIEVDLRDIARVKTKCNGYNTITITTRFGDRYELHPKDMQALEDILRKYAG